MTFSERAQAVVAFGFTERQAAFLVTVALHSGFCLRRQLAAFAGVKYGKNVCEFLEGLVAREFAVRFRYRGDAGHIYHLNARRLYRAIRQEDNRNRRTTSPPLVVRKLMLLDFVLSEGPREWYATEEDKVDLFVHRIGVPPEALPQRVYRGGIRGDQLTTTRYHVQKLPLYVTGEPAHVHFVCLVTSRTAAEIENFGREHEALLGHLPAWTLLVTGPRDVATSAQCVTQFTRAFGAEAISATAAELRWLFETRRTLERGDLASLSVADLRRYRDARARWSGRLEHMYAQWMAGGAGERLVGAAKVNGAMHVRWLPHTYEHFGSLPGVS